MDVERVEVVKTLKAGGRVYTPKHKFDKPFPPSIVSELRAVLAGKSDTLRILSTSGKEEEEVKVVPPSKEELKKEKEANASEDILTEKKKMERLQKARVKKALDEKGVEIPKQPIKLKTKK